MELKSTLRLFTAHKKEVVSSAMPKAPPDFKRRTAKVGRKLAPVNETRIEVKFGTLDAARRPPSPGAAGAEPAAALRDALLHTAHHSEGQRHSAVFALRNLLGSAPAAVRQQKQHSSRRRERVPALWRVKRWPPLHRQLLLQRRSRAHPPSYQRGRHRAHPARPNANQWLRA